LSDRSNYNRAVTGGRGPAIDSYAALYALAALAAPGRNTYRERISLPHPRGAIAMPFAAHTASLLPPGSFAGQTVLITGGGTGLGRSMGRYLLTLGANLAICGRRDDVLQETARELQAETDGQVLAQACDVREPAQVEALLAAAWQRFGRVDALVNNAAGNFICPTERLSYNAFNTVVDIVLRGTAHCSLACGRRWIADGRGGTLLNIVATYAWTGSAYVVPSATAKAGVLALTQSLAVEWGRHGIRANAIAPGPFPTEGAWSRLLPPEAGDLFDPAGIPAGRVGEHAELANLAAYLLSGYSTYINGECITIDGGQWLRGASEFNNLDRLSPEQWDAIQARLRPKKRE
jgi:NAD(P)-dependent dehydrogenase (short-subunit alcohol dehydrogenase family)